MVSYPKTVPWSRPFFPGLSRRKSRLDPKPVGFVVDKVALRMVSFRVLRFFPFSIIPPMPHFTPLPSTLYHVSSRQSLNKKHSKTVVNNGTGDLVTK